MGNDELKKLLVQLKKMIETAMPEPDKTDALAVLKQISIMVLPFEPHRLKK